MTIFGSSIFHTICRYSISNALYFPHLLHYFFFMVVSMHLSALLIASGNKNLRSRCFWWKQGS